MEGLALPFPEKYKQGKSCVTLNSPKYRSEQQSPLR